MRIVLASFASLPQSIGGGEVHVYQLARALRDKGHNASILTVDRVGVDHVTVRNTILNEVPIHHLEMPECSSQYDREPRLIAWAREWLKSENVDALHLFLFNHLLGLIPAANDLGIPVCLTALEFSYFCRRYDLMYEGRERCSLEKRGEVCERCALVSYSSRQRFAAQAARIMPPTMELGFRESVSKFVGDRFVGLGQRSLTAQIEQQRMNFDREIAAVITPSTIMRDFYLAQGVDRSKLHFVPYGSDLESQSNGHGKQHTTVRLGYIGRIDPKKGVDVLCEAVHMLPPQPAVELNIFGPIENANGSSGYAEQIRQMAAADSRITIRGKLERDSVMQAYNEIDVLVVPSIWYENSPITISEALSLGCPVICSDTEGMSDLVKNGINGLTFPAGDKLALTKCLRRLTDEPDLLAGLRSRVRPVENSAQVAGLILEVYRQMSDML
jgi:glycosyltransferase involved in cell wall biosynthesis